MNKSENLCLLLVGKALFIQGFWGASEEVPVTRDMTVTRDATIVKEREEMSIHKRHVYTKRMLWTSNRLERLQFIANRIHGGEGPMPRCFPRRNPNTPLRLSLLGMAMGTHDPCTRRVNTH
jgi:hypothetical protein